MGKMGIYLLFKFLNSRLDMLVNTVNKTGVFIQAFYNYISIDAFYLKSLGINGQC